MSCESISLHPFIPSCQPAPTIMVGDDRIADLFFEAMQQYNSILFVERDPLVNDEDGSSMFGRDWGVIGLNHTYLLPGPLLPTDMLDYEFRTYLPSHSSFVNGPRCGYGRGFYPKYVSNALSYMKENHLPYTEMRSTIEGGNCYVFFGPNGEPRAVVGENSVALTLLGLERQLDFAEETREILQRLLETIETPSDEAIRKARNISLFTRLKAWVECRDYLETNRATLPPLEIARFEAYLRDECNTLVSPYYELLAAPLTEEEKIQCHEEGRIWEAKMQLALNVIAEDLGVPLKNLAIVPQTDFHIDMEMFIAPNGENVYLDERAVRNNPMIIEELEKIGCRVFVVPGVHQVGRESVNFMNGIFVPTPKGPLFVTNGTGEDEESQGLRGRFIQRVEDSFEGSNFKFRVHFLDETQEILTEQDGGIHCLTREEPYFETPLDIVLSYVGGSIPHQRIRVCAGKILACLNMSLIDVLRSNDGYCFTAPTRIAVIDDSDEDPHAASK